VRLPEIVMEGATNTASLPELSGH